MTENSGPTDLLGDPLRPLPDRRGRRKLRFPVEIYEKVEVLVAAGLDQDEIADALGISDKSLRKYFRQELDKALSRKKADAVSMLEAAARAGNVSAIKAWNAELDRQRAARAMIERERPRERAEAPIGKKEARHQAATNVAATGSKFAPPAPPRLSVVKS